VTKTLTPDQDGDGIGGSIDFRTPTAFDFQNDLTLRAYGAAGFNQQAKDAGEAAGTYQGSSISASASLMAASACSSPPTTG
jgi:hypothetical protein